MRAERKCAIISVTTINERQEFQNETFRNILQLGSYIDEDKLGPMGIIDKAAELGFDGIEFADGGWSKNLDLNLAQKIKEHCAEKNLKVVAYCVGANFLGDFDEEVARTKRNVDLAAAMGAKNMRHDVAYGFPADRIPSATTTRSRSSRRACLRSPNTPSRRASAR